MQRARRRARVLWFGALALAVAALVAGNVLSDLFRSSWYPLPLGIFSAAFLGLFSTIARGVYIEKLKLYAIQNRWLVCLKCFYPATDTTEAMFRCDECGHNWDTASLRAFLTEPQKHDPPTSYGKAR